MKTTKSIRKQLENFIAENGFGHPSSYAGPDFSDYIVLIGSNRDADLLTQSNWEVACELFPEDESENTLHITQGHWACGWIELLLIKHVGFEKDINIRLNLYKAMKTREALDDYPVLDDSHFCEHERNSMHENFEGEKKYFIRDLAEFIDINIDNLDEITINQLEEICLYTYEADCEYCGYDQGYFIADHENLSRGVEFIEDNQLMTNNSPVLNQLKSVLKYQAA